jgi:hypothetical protein
MPTSIAGAHFPWWPPTGSHPVEMRSHETNVTHDTNPSQA